MRLQSNAHGGVTIDFVHDGSDASKKGLRAGDVIVAVAGRQTPTPEDVSAVITQAGRTHRKAVLLLVTHAGDWSLVSLSLANAKG
ncbi:PDZ domain-containing protein [Phenylobacterium montanum]|nr:PDZ domain-containing protein [Caulobacter sp. S6]